MHARATGAGTLVTLLARRADEQPSSPFLVYEDLDGAVERRSYEETMQRAKAAAAALHRLGVRRGDLVHVHLWNSPEFFDAWFGAVRLGAVIVPTNPLLTSDELAYVVTHAACKLSITQPALIETVRRALGRRGVVLSTLIAEPPDGVLSFEQELALAGEGPLVERPAPTDPAAVLYTSGTTSRPKGVVVTHANYLHVGTVVARHLRVVPDDRTLITLPLFHANAQYYCTMPALTTGSSVIVMQRFSASRWLDVAARHSATLASLFAAPIRMLLAQPERDIDARNELRTVVFSQNVTPSQLDDFERRFDCPLLQLYGMTETIAPPTLNPLDGERRNMSIGRPIDRAQIRVVDDGGEDVPNGEVGELLVRGRPGTTLMAGYLGDEAATRRTIVDGWLHTGDNVRRDEDGYLHFVDRSTDMIKRAGENVAASEVEGVVNSHWAVYESAAIGVPDEMRDEAIKVYVVLGDEKGATEEELIEWCAGRLAKFKVPDTIEFVDGLPRTSVGKIQRAALRTQPRL
ncbi:MAG: AMP-binding protein [Actinomycetota bacterium]